MMDDLISRQDALTEIRKDGKWLEEQGVTSMTTNEREMRDTFILREMPSAQPNVHDFPKDADCISRQAAIDALKNRWKKTRNYEGIGDDIAEECELYLKQVPSAQPEDWMERNKERILQAGMEGREIEFRIGGRLFAIREKAQ